MHNVLLHHGDMKISRVIALGLSLALASAGPTFADPAPTPTYDYQSLLAQFKIAKSAFQAEMNSREHLRMAIDQSFMSAVNDANRTARNALRTAKIPLAKSEVLAIQRAAIALANSTRYSAILAMGQPPEEPVPPIKPEQSSKVATLKKTKTPKASPSP